MRKRFIGKIGLLSVLSALVLSVASAVPAEAAAKFYMSVRSSNIAIDAAGNGQVFARCNASTTCRGRIYFIYDRASLDGGYAHKSINYALPARSYGYIKVAMYQNSPLNPNVDGNPNIETSSGIKAVRNNVRLMVAESSPRGTVPAHSYAGLTAEEQITSQKITGSIEANPNSAPVSNLKVSLWEPQRGGNNRLIATRDASGGTYEFTVPFRENNVARSTYRLKIEGIVDGKSRSWWWRGRDGVPTGGGRYLRDASAVTATKSAPFQADFRYGYISGQITEEAHRDGARVKITAPPPSYSGSATDLQELDIERCANVYGETIADSDGKYRVDFLPATGFTDNRYIVGASAPFGSIQMESWKGAGSRGYGSCYDATGYSYSIANLITLAPGSNVSGVNMSLHIPAYQVGVPVRVSGFTPTAADQWVRIREKVPGLSINDMPIVSEGQGKTGEVRDFKVPPGTFVIETGRFSGDTGKSPLSPCTGWYPSVYADNSAYFSGADRGAERWKTVAGVAEEYHKSVDMGYIRRSPGSGKKGWMYRNYCKSLSRGTFNNTIAFAGDDDVSRKVITSMATASRGGVVYGTVKRNGGRTNKEMMVRVVNSGGTVVARYDLTDGSGKFYVAGLYPGTYSISVNSDSWRGIGRSFKGKHTIKVSGSGYYSAGTLYFRG